jgi:hypothetical protein
VSWKTSDMLIIRPMGNPIRTPITYPISRRFSVTSVASASDPSLDQLIVRQNLAVVRHGQTRDDVEQRRLATSARADQANKLALVYMEGNLVERMHACARRAKPFGYALYCEFGGQSRTDSQHQGFSIKRVRPGTPRRKPTA